MTSLLNPHRLVVVVIAAAVGGCSCSGGQDDRQFVTVAMEPLTEPVEATQPNADDPLDRSGPPEPGEARAYTLPDVRHLTLSNGLEVTLVNRPGFPTIASRLSIRAGRDAIDGSVAVPELTSRVLRDGTSTRSADEIATFVDGAGLAFNIHVEANRVVLSADAVSSQLPQILNLLSDLSANATFPDDRVSARRTEYIAELLRSSAEPDYHRDQLWRRVAFGEHPYSKLHPSEDAIESVTPEALRDFYQSTYAPARARLVIVGELPNDIDSQLADTFGAWTNASNAYRSPAPISLTTCNEAHVVVRPESVQTSILWVGPGVSIASAEYVRARVANQIFGGGPSARLFMNLREDKSYTYGAYSSTRDLLGAAAFIAYSNVRGEVTSLALNEFELEFARIQAEDFPADELTDARNYLSGVFPIQLETNAQLAGRISSLLDLGISLDFLSNYRELVNEVTSETATPVGQTLINRPNLALVMVGTEENALPAARAHASVVYVYDLDGELIDTLDGELESTCGL